MVRLGDVLEAIHNSRRSFQTVRAIGRAEDGTWRVWRQQPDRSRAEHGDTVLVHLGSVWWRWDPADGGSTNEKSVGSSFQWVMPSPLDHLFDPTPLLSAELQFVGEATVAGRRAALVRARRRTGRDGPFGSTWRLEDETDVAIDLDAGVALRAGGVDLDEVHFDEQLPAALFDRPFPRGAERPAPPRPRDVTLDEARALVPFRVLLPTVVPEGARLGTCTVAGEDPPAWVSLHYVVDPGRRYSFSIEQGKHGLVPEGDLPPGTERLVVEGLEVTLVEHAGESFRTFQLWLRSHDVPVFITSDLPRDILLPVALSLEPA